MINQMVYAMEAGGNESSRSKSEPADFGTEPIASILGELTTLTALLVFAKP